jgi:hypothetical protein
MGERQFHLTAVGVPFPPIQSVDGNFRSMAARTGGTKAPSPRGAPSTFEQIRGLSVSLGRGPVTTAGACGICDV